MEKLTFYYSAMKGGKTDALLQVAYNYEQNGMKVVVLKSSIDTKGKDCIVSRNGSKRKVDIILEPNERVISKKNSELLKDCNCILVDGAQFLTARQVEDLFMITKQISLPVICYGLKTNFKGELFEGSKRLIELADNIDELDMVPLCSCGQKARFNGRKENGVYTLSGDEVEIDGVYNNVEHVSLCSKCYYQKVFKKKLR
ncbi:MAG: thymidine kinase [Firmicutes bacterium]|nr:thymidine kinase [Bacillota bacterium]